MSTERGAQDATGAASRKRRVFMFDFNLSPTLQHDADRIKLADGYGKPYVGPFHFADAKSRKPATVYADPACRVPYPTPAATGLDGLALPAFTKPGQNVQLVIERADGSTSRHTFPRPER